LINIPWAVVACIEPSESKIEIPGNTLVEAIVVSTWMGYVWQLVTIIVALDVYRRMWKL